MAIDRIHFQTEAEAQAYECGLWFQCPPPFQTMLSGDTVTITSDFGHNQTDHECRWNGVSADSVNVGDNPLVSEIVFPTISEAQAFHGGLSWYSTAFLNVALSGLTVTVSEHRSEGENAAPLHYDLATLRRLIANYRTKFPIMLTSA